MSKDTQEPATARGEVTLDRLLEVTAYNLYGACLVGNPAPRVKALLDRIREPQVGDLVLETSTIWLDTPGRAGTRIGRLARVTREPVFTNDQWREAGGRDDEPIPTERVWYIELLDGREYRWTNASFITMLTEIHR